MTFGEKLRYYRKAKSLTQAELANQSGLSLNTIMNYERGRTYPQDRNVYVKLADVLGIDSTYLKNEGDDETLPEIDSEAAAGLQADRLVKQIGALFAGGKLSEEDMDAVMLELHGIHMECKRENLKYGKRKKNNEE